MYRARELDRRDAEAIRQAKLASMRSPPKTPMTPGPSSGTIPATSMGPTCSSIPAVPQATVPVPIAFSSAHGGPNSRAAKDLPESALLLLRELWANLGKFQIKLFGPILTSPDMINRVRRGEFC